MTSDQDTLKEGKTIVIPFESDLGKFYFEVWFPKDFDPVMLT